MNQLRFQWAVSNAGTRLIIASVAVFLIINVPLSLLHLLNLGDIEGTINSWLVLPGSLGTLIFKPWTLFTHMFMHTGLLHLIFNMLTLYFSCQLLNRYFDDRRLINVYFVGGFAGALTFLFSVNVFPLFTSMGSGFTAAGASAATLAVLIAISAYRPDDEVFLFGAIRMKLMWLATIIVLLDLLQIRSGNAAGHLAHLGGAAFGIIWAMQLRKGNDIAAFFGRVQDLFKPGKKSKMRVAHRRPLKDEEYNLSKKEQQMQIDEILDKISRSGYDSLSKEEKSRLFELTKDK